MPLHTIFSTKGLYADRTEPTRVNSSEAKSRPRKGRMLRIYIAFQAIKFYCFPPPRPPPSHFNCFTSTTTSLLFFFPPPPHFYCFPSTTTTTGTTFLLFSLHHHHHHISIVFFPPPPPPPHFYCFPPAPQPPHFHCFPSTRFYKRLPAAILSSFCSNVSCSKQQSWFSSTVS